MAILRVLGSTPGPQRSTETVVYRSVMGQLPPQETPDADPGLMQRLERIYASRHGPVAIVDAAAAMLAARLGQLGADVGFVAAVTPDGETVEVARVTPHSNVPVRLAFPISAPYPLAAAIRFDARMFISSNEALACDHPGIVRIRGEDHACATVPLHGSDGRVVGSLNVSFEDPRDFTDADRALIDEATTECEAVLAHSRDRPA